MILKAQLNLYNKKGRINNILLMINVLTITNDYESK